VRRLIALAASACVAAGWGAFARANAGWHVDPSNGELHALANELVSELRKQSPGDRVAAAVRDTFADSLTSYRIDQPIVRGEAGLGGLQQKTAEGIAAHFVPK
jgi:hypothetical protein